MHILSPILCPLALLIHAPRFAPPQGSATPLHWTHMQAGVVGEQPVVTQRHVLLLPLFVQGLATPLQQDALRTEARSTSGARPTRPCDLA